jgi:hypothetical protein
MPQRRVSTKVLKERGAYLRNPKRAVARAREPKYTGPLGDPPEKMSAAHKALWAELSAIVPEGVAEKSDRWMFEVLVCLMADFRKGVARGGEVSQLLNLLAKLGMTPADRSRVAANTPPSPQKDKWAEFNLPEQTQ